MDSPSIAIEYYSSSSSPKETARLYGDGGKVQQYAWQRSGTHGLWLKVDERYAEYHQDLESLLDMEYFRWVNVEYPEPKHCRVSHLDQLIFKNKNKNKIKN